MRLSNSLPLVIILLALTLLVSACSREVRYQTLTFFFTGVPPLDYQPPAALPTQASAAPLNALEKYALARRVADAQRSQSMSDYTHGPFAGEKCDACHQTQIGGGFGFGGGGADKVTVMPTDFQAPRQELCIGCHTSKGPKAIAAAGLRLHGPAMTDCTLCHHPHASKEPFFFRVAADKLCQQCHAEGFIADAPLHADAGRCLDCHNPHLGRDALMLRDDFLEVFE